MSRTYSTELKEQILNDYRYRRSIRALAADYKPHEMTIRSWIQKLQAIPHVGVESQADDLKRLRRELRHLQEDNAIQKSRGQNQPEVHLVSIHPSVCHTNRSINTSIC